MPLTREQALRELERADLVCSSSVLHAAVARMAREISSALEDCFPLVLCVMRGAVVFSGHLLPQLGFPLEFDYLDVSRYRETTEGGSLAWRIAPDERVTQRVVLVLDDVMDEGHTLAAIREQLLANGARSVLVAVLIDKAVARTRPLRPDFTGVTLPDRYLFGFGMDVRGLWRNLPDIYALGEGG